MAIEKDPNGVAQQDGEEVSWEDAFAAAASETGDDEAAPQASGAPAAAPASPPEPAASGGSAPTREETPGGKVDLDFLLDIPLEVTVEVGRKRILVNDLLQMQQGSVITLEKMVGESFEVLVNGKLMALGEVVMINEKFGIRLTDVIDPKERLEKLA